MASPVQAQLMPLSNVLQLAQRCFDGDSPSSCQIVLDRAEQLQRSAAVQEFYPCQTLLLGLQADVIMQQLGHGRADRAQADLQTIARGCTGL